ncbi:tripartite tricarboxylate transporter substrate binding protein [Belnapia sp. T6]|uniref:Tripartite tricarboxylate transporter substrate binding protein n=1 Tax=Belnapia mucosa TaxID=2804532 RepID=A0ABS1V4I7_9PROT|nr:tripartite tricarboxylate transporter substrate binding protein [Belnapia mucosa]MBL6456614.1 tripartite tricarboxylate transporter substrate binding protein [Belnapia mucosa]
MVSRRGLLASPVLLVPASQGHATGRWPDQPIRILTPSPPGSSVDAAARVVADGLARRYEQSFVVDNRPGADGVVAADAFAKSRPGSTLLFCASGLYTAAPLMFAPLPYDTEAELLPIASAVTDFLGFVVPPGALATTFDAVIARARGNPGWMSWAAAPGAYLVINAFFRAAGIEASYVNYRALTAMLPDVAMGRLDLAYVPLTPTMPLVRDGKLRLLAVSNATRAPVAPDIPTVREAGFPDLENEGFPGLFGWKGMPMALREQVAAHMRAIVGDPAAIERFGSLGLAPRPATPASFTADLQRVTRRYTEAARRYGAKPVD